MPAITNALAVCSGVLGPAWVWEVACAEIDGGLICVYSSVVWVSFSGLSSRDFYDICHCTYLSAIRQLIALEVPVIDDLKTGTT